MKRPSTGVAVLVGLLAVAGLVSVYHQSGTGVAVVQEAVSAPSSPVALLQDDDAEEELGHEWQATQMLDEDHGDIDLDLNPSSEDMLEDDGGEQEDQHEEMLYQIGDQEFLAPSQGGVEDMALEVERALAHEQKLLKKIDARATKHQRVDIDVVAGQIGKRGGPGPRGYMGPKGFPGPRGYRGPRGYMGARGIQGIQGIKGVKGDDGKTGPTGKTGPVGPRGPQGPLGRRGREGLRGPEGTVGPNGAPGKPGKMGEMGPPGPPASVGKTGLRGPRGPRGPPGIDGVDGQRGPQGPRGKKGMDGDTGPRGYSGYTGDRGKSQCGLASDRGKRICCGEVAGSGFRKVSWNTFMIDVNTEKCNFRGQPKYFTSVFGTSHHWGMWTQDDIVSSDPNRKTMDPRKFRVYLQASHHVHMSHVHHYKYSLRWCGVGDTPAPPLTKYAMCCGSQKKGWRQYGSQGLYMDVDMGGCGWPQEKSGQTGGLKEPPPTIFAELSDSTCRDKVFTSQTSRCAATVRGVQSIYSAANRKFRVYMRSLPGKQGLNAARSAQNHWRINWCAFKRAHPTPKPGFPCTAPRLLAGATSSNTQRTITNDGSICCGTTGDNWKDGGAGFLKQEVNMAMCGFKYPPTTILTGLRGKTHTARRAGGASSYTTTGDFNKIVVYAWTGGIGNFPAYKAHRDAWKVEWCAVGRK